MPYFSVFDISLVLILDTYCCVISMLSLSETDLESIHQDEVLSSHGGHPLWECVQSQYYKPLLITASKK